MLIAGGRWWLLSIECVGGGAIVSLCRCPLSFVGLDGGRLVSFVGIRPFCVVGSCCLWVAGVGDVFACRPLVWSVH